MIGANLPLSGNQLRSLQEATGHVNLWEGSIRSGKTIVSILRWLIFVATAPRIGELVIVGRTRDSAWRNIIAPMQTPDLFGHAAACVIGNHGAPTVTVLGRRVYVMGASDAKAEKVLRGLTVAGAYVDEATTIPEEFFTQLLGRMSVDGAKLFGTTNPDSPAHWLRKRFLNRLNELPGWRTWHFVMDDNPVLTEEFKAAKRAEFTGLWFRRFILGEWVAAEGAVYPMWDEATHVIPYNEMPRLGRLISVGVDYGTTNPTSAVLLGITEDHQRMILVDEWRHDPALTRQRLTDAQLSQGLRDWLATARLNPVTQNEYLRPHRVAVDPAAASFKVQLAADSVRGLMDAENDVNYGIRTVASLLGSHQLLVTDRCTGFLSEVTGYSWDDKASEKGADKPVKTADHSLDAARYAVASTESWWRRHLHDTTTTTVAA